MKLFFLFVIHIVLCISILLILYLGLNNNHNKQDVTYINKPELVDDVLSKGSALINQKLPSTLFKSTISKNNKVLENVEYNGISSPQYSIPKSENTDYKIASPIKEGLVTVNKSSRIIADEYPELTVSSSKFDLPDKKDVISINIPKGKTTVTEMHFDPRVPLKTEVGTYSTDNIINNSFVPNIMAESKFKQYNNGSYDEVKQKLKYVKQRAKDILLNNNIQTTDDNSLIIPIDVKNKHIQNNNISDTNNNNNNSNEMNDDKSNNIVDKRIIVIPNNDSFQTTESTATN